MTTMSDDGDRTCPLCAEEMDITDQQLKPCKCGYEICVWCWHHIMEMAEKEETEGRCPACRTRYDKDRIVKMAASCERMVAEINAEKKQKTQKVKPKATVEAKKHLTSVRVIQRNLVYIIGLPASLCDESILERREYFGQYGKVQKVSISRPTGAAAQQGSTNNTFSVYITYAREEEAIRCIQAVHNFVLEGKALRACFGTTKYCHAWLRNMTCGNPDCLYLHDVGSQEDSFTKDEIISAYTRSRFPPIGSSASQRRAGTVLPPPADDFSYSAAVSAKQTVKSGTNNTSSQTKVSPPNSSSGKSTLPAAASWGLRTLSSRPTAAGVTCSQALTKLKVESQSNSILNSSTIASTRPPSAWNDDTSTVPKMPESRQVSDLDTMSKILKPYKPGIAKETQAITSSESSLDIDFSTIPSAWNDDEVVISVATSKLSEEKQVGHGNGKHMGLESSKPVEAVHLPSKSATSPKNYSALNGTKQSSSGRLSHPVTSTSEVKGGDGDHLGSNMIPIKSPSLKVISNQSNGAAIEKITEGINPVDANIQNLSIGISSVCLDNNHGVQSLARNQYQNAVPNSPTEMPSSQDSRLEQSHSKFAELLSSLPGNKDILPSSQSSSDKHFDWSSEMQSRGVMPPVNDMGNSSLATDKRIFGLSDVADQASSSPSLHSVNTSNISSWNDTGSKHAFTGDSRISDSVIETRLFSSRGDSASTLSNGHHEELRTVYRPEKVSEHPGMKSLEHEATCAVKNGNAGSFDKSASVHKEESSIISDILSLEFDPWGESYSSANNFVKMLGESEKNDVPFDISSSWKSKTSSNESRFSFARQDGQGSLLESSLRNCGHEQNFNLLSQNSHGGAYQNGLAFQSFEGPNEISKSNSLPTLDRGAAGTSRSKISAPPGFSAPSRVPPPGFSSQDRSNQVYDSAYSESRLHDNLLGGNANHYQPQLTRNSSDIEFVDPAILAVGKGRMPGVSDSGLELKSMPTFPTQFNTSNSDPRLQLFMQQAMSSHQNLRLSDHIGDTFMPMNDNYLASRLLAQNHGSLSPFAQLQMSLQQPRNSHLANGQWDGWSDLWVGNNMGMADLMRNERFGLNGMYPTNEENNFHIPSSNDIYNRAFGL